CRWRPVVPQSQKETEFHARHFCHQVERRPVYQVLHCRKELSRRNPVPIERIFLADRCGRPIARRWWFLYPDLVRATRKNSNRLIPAAAIVRSTKPENPLSKAFLHASMLPAWYRFPL